MEEFDVIVVGGGITGAGTARDCALRGLKVLLIERGDIATGATGITVCCTAVLVMQLLTRSLPLSASRRT